MHLRLTTGDTIECVACLCGLTILRADTWRHHVVTANVRVAQQRVRASTVFLVVVHDTGRIGATRRR